MLAEQQIRHTHAYKHVSTCLLPAPPATCREDNIKGYVALAPPLGGSTYAIATKLGGAKISLIDFIGDILQPMINELVYHGSRGLPSMLMLMPNRHLWGKDFVSQAVSQLYAAGVDCRGPFG